MKQNTYLWCFEIHRNIIQTMVQTDAIIITPAMVQNAMNADGSATSSSIVMVAFIVLHVLAKKETNTRQINSCPDE